MGRDTTSSKNEQGPPENAAIIRVAASSTTTEAQASPKRANATRGASQRSPDEDPSSLHPSRLSSARSKRHTRGAPRRQRRMLPSYRRGRGRRREQAGCTVLALGSSRRSARRRGAPGLHVQLFHIYNITGAARSHALSLLSNVRYRITKARRREPPRNRLLSKSSDAGTQARDHMLTSTEVRLAWMVRAVAGRLLAHPTAMCSHNVLAQAAAT